MRLCIYKIENSGSDVKGRVIKVEGMVITVEAEAITAPTENSTSNATQSVLD